MKGTINWYIKTVFIVQTVNPYAPPPPQKKRNFKIGEKIKNNVNAVCILQDSEKPRGGIFESVKFEEKKFKLKVFFSIYFGSYFRYWQQFYATISDKFPKYSTSTMFSRLWIAACKQHQSSLQS